MADSFSQFEMLLREYIEPGVTDLELAEDDVMWHLLDTFEATDVAGRRADGDAGTAGYEASWKIKVQSAGLVTGGDWAGNTLTMMGAGSDLPMGQAVDSLWPDPRTVPLRGYLTIKMILSRIRGMLTCNTQQILADLASEPIEEISGGYVEDAVEQIRKICCDWSWGDGTGTLAQFTAAGTVYEAAASVTYLSVKNGTPRRFKKGQRYVLVTDADPYVLLGTVRCVGIDMRDRKVAFQAEAGVGNITVADGTRILYHGSYDFTASSVANGRKAHEGIESLLLDSGTFPGTSLSVADYPELRSNVVGSTTADTYPTPEIIALEIDRITDASLPMPDVLVAEQSLWTLYAQQERQAGANYPVPNGGTFVANGGVDGPQFTHGGKTFSRLSSALCRENTVFGLSTETWKRFMPLGNKNIKWFFTQGGLAGAGSVFGPVYSGVQLDESMQAPFHTFIQLGNTDPRRNFIRKGLYNQRDVTA